MCKKILFRGLRVHAALYNMALNGRRPLVMLMDWDETISAHDTLALIAPPDGQHTGRASFSSYGQAYMNDLAEHERTWKKQNTTTTATTKDELGQAWTEYWTFLVSLDAVELASQRRIEQGQLFLDFDAEAMDERARKDVTLRPGWTEFVEARLTGENDAATVAEWHVISVGWSARFIRTALENARPQTICANEVELDVNTGRGTGRLTKARDGIRTAAHKLREMREIVERRRQDTPFTVYFGDSPTDLGCLVNANVGFVVGGKESMAQAIVKAGLNKFLCDGSLEERRIHVANAAAAAVTNASCCLVTAIDWHEVNRLIDVLVLRSHQTVVQR